MSSFEDSYKSQLQGVSQQIARERLDGQVSAQDNMLSDTVTNLRRRPGAAFAFSLAVANATADSVVAWDTDLAGTQCTVLLNCADGVVRLLAQNYAVLATLPASAYLTTANPTDIQATTVGAEFFLANVKKTPALVATTARNPTDRGMFYIRAGAFSKKFEVKVQSSLGSTVASYTTPSGTTAGDAALASPENIADQIVIQINAGTATSGVKAFRDSSYVYLEAAPTYTITALAVSTPSGDNYLVASGQSYLRQEANLPSRLPAEADGYIISTGELKTLRFYMYVAAKFAWLECGDALGPSGLTNMPVSIALLAGVWVLDSTAYEGRLAGNDDNNPVPSFITNGVTGLASYQGRLVILAGSMISMSASSKPRRFFRSTVTELLDSDCIHIGASAASSAAYRHAVPFQKDLLLFSEKYQAVVPGGNSAITPRTASVVVTSTYDSDMTAKPIPIGRTLMYPAPRSADFFGMMEMLPSTITDSQYTSFDATAHLPKYLAGRCRFGVSSSVANMVLFAPTGDRNSLIVHEYTWLDDKKLQQAWHRWTFRYPVAAAYFSGQVVHVLFVQNGLIVACTIDPRQGLLTAAAERRPYLDMSVFVDVVNHTVTYPAWIQTFDPAALEDLKLSVASGAMSGEPVGFTTNGTTMTTVRSFPAGRVAIGFPYRSSFSPTPPMVKDENGVKISSNKLTVLRFMIGTNNSAQYEVSVSDSTTPDDAAFDVGTLYFSSNELQLSQARVGEDSIATVPCRTSADSTSLVISTDGMGELNLVSLEYVARYHEKIKRAKAKNV